MKNKIILSILTCLSVIAIVLIVYRGKNNTLEDSKDIPTKNSDMLSMMLETEAGSGEYKVVEQSEWPTLSDGYKFNSTLSKCENGSEVSWDDENNKVVIKSNISDKCYIYFDVHNPTLEEVCSGGDDLAYCVKSYGDLGPDVSNIYIHNSSLTNGAGDNSYRYAGADPDNYICIGSTATTCPDANLFRIIGVFDDEVKVIKATSIDYMQWNSTTSNTWSSSSLNTYLNGTYLSSLSWTEIIVSATWKVGGNTISNIRSVIPKTAYTNEITNVSTTYTAEVGLMYVSDYYFASSQESWSITGGYNDEIILENWLNISDSQWTITPITDDSTSVFAINRMGSISPTVVDSSEITRPVFYLGWYGVSIYPAFQSGTGTYSNPIRVTVAENLPLEG